MEEYTSFMVKRLPIFMLIFTIPLAFAQLDSNSVTVTAARSTLQQPDQVVFAVSVQSGLNTTLDDVVAALQGSGITAANFSGVSMGPQYILSAPVSPLPATLMPMLQWTFALSAQLAKIKDTIATLSALQKTIAQQNKGFTLSFSVQSAQVSAQSQQSQACPIPDLLVEARAQAQKLADAAGLSLGNVLAMSSGVSYSVGAPAAVSIAGFLTAPLVSPLNCSMTVKFALLRY